MWKYINFVETSHLGFLITASLALIHPINLHNYFQCKKASYVGIQASYIYHIPGNKNKYLAKNWVVLHYC